MKMPGNKKIIVLLFLLGFTLPIFVRAQVLNSTVPVNDDAVRKALLGNDFSSLLGGVLGSGFDDAAKTFNDSMNKIATAGAACTKGVDALLSVADQANQWSFGGLKLLSGSAGEAAMIQGKMDALTTARTCVLTQLSLADLTTPTSVLGAQKKQILMDNLTKAKNTIDLRLDGLNEQLRVAQRGFWKAVLVKTLISTTKAITQRAVQNLTNKYKIQDFQHYADAVATQVYDVQLIRDNAKDNRDQLILRSMLTNPLVRNEIQSSVYQRAADALQLDGQPINPAQMDYTDPNYLKKLAMVGAPEANPYFVQVHLKEQADTIQSKGKDSAMAELAVSKGLKAPRNCAGVVGQQDAIDNQWQALQDQYDNRKKLLNDLLNAQSLQQAGALGGTISNDDIKKAQADFDRVSAQLKAMPDSQKRQEATSNGEDYTESPLVQLCATIASPADQVGNIIDQFIDKYSQTLSDYNDNNLPLFTNLISDVATNLSTRLIFGGNVDASVVTNARSFDKAIPTALNFAQYEHDQNIVSGIRFSYNRTYNEPTNAAYTEYELNWDATSVTDAASVYIAATPALPTGGSNPAVPAELAGKKMTELSGSVTFQLAKAGQYTFVLTVSRKGSTQLYNVPLTINYAGPAQVKGASITREIPIRGSTELMPRGKLPEGE